MIVLRILRPFGLWNAGENAGFPPERAAELVAQGFAERVGEPVVEVSAPEPAEAEPAAETEQPEAGDGDEPAPTRRRKG